MNIDKYKRFGLNILKLIGLGISMNAQQAVEVAQQSLLSIFKLNYPDSLRLEEIEMNGEYWEVTLSFVEPAKGDTADGHSINTLSLMGISQVLNSNKRSYKTVFVNKETGDVESIKIYKND